MTSRHHIAVVLSGGGAKAAAHVGALRALEERRVRVDRFVGTSMGAVVAAAFAAGMTYDEVLRRVLTLSRRDVARVSWSLLMGPYATSLLQHDQLRRTVASLVPVRRFSELTVPLTVTAVDVRTGELVLFGDGGDALVPLVDALSASCSLPVLYPPTRIAGQDLADGGLRSVLPLGVAASFQPSIMFAVRVGPSFAARPASPAPSTPPLLRAHNQAMRTLMAAQTDAEVGRWRGADVPLILVEPVVDQAATFAVGKAVAYVEEGYRRAVAALERSPHRDLLARGRSNDGSVRPPRGSGPD
jgi:NTE family protein